MAEPVRAFLALGSNVGDRAAALQRAVDGLSVPGVVVAGVSDVYETDAMGPPQDDYLNAVVALDTTLAARDLLELARGLESAAGREPDPARRERWGPRELDVDVLIVGEEQIDEEDLIVPHPGLSERPFVLAPLADVAPDLPVVRAGREAHAGASGEWPGVRRTDVELRIT